MREHTIRESRLECVRVAFPGNADAVVAFTEYYTGLPDPADFAWLAATAHIADRLGLSVDDLKRLHAATEPLEDALDRMASEIAEAYPGERGRF